MDCKHAVGSIQVVGIRGALVQCRLGSPQPYQVAGEAVEVDRGLVGGHCLPIDEVARSGGDIGPEFVLQNQVAASHAVPGAPSHEGVHSNTAGQTKGGSCQTATATNKNGPHRGP